LNVQGREFVAIAYDRKKPGMGNTLNNLQQLK